MLSPPRPSTLLIIIPRDMGIYGLLIQGYWVSLCLTGKPVRVKGNWSHDFDGI